MPSAKQKNHITVDVEVNEVIEEFVKSIYGSDTIILERQSFLGTVIRPMLFLAPKKYLKKKYKHKIKVKLLNWTDRGLDTRYRNYLDETAQYFVKEHLYFLFKETLHNFVLASVMNGTEQKQSIYLFATTYDIPLNKITYEMMKKSWDRSIHKCRWRMQKDVFKEELRKINYGRLKTITNIKKIKPKTDKSQLDLSFTQLTLEI